MDFSAPTAFPFSILDYGLTVCSLIVLGFIVWLFVKFLTNHMSKTVKLQDDLVQTMRSIRDETFRLSEEVREFRSEFSREVDYFNERVKDIHKINLAKLGITSDKSKSD